MEKAKLQSIVESILFANGDPMSIKQLSRIIGVKENDVVEVVDALKEEYGEQKSGLVILQIGSNIQFATKPENSEYLEKLKKAELSETLSSAALEVLSIVAYRGPVSKPEIESIRGVNCAYTVRNLLMRGLIEKSENPQDARGYVYSITFDLLKKFGIDDVKKLPEYDILSKDERLEVIKDDNEQKMTN